MHQLFPAPARRSQTSFSLPRFLVELPAPFTLQRHQTHALDRANRVPRYASLGYTYITCVRPKFASIELCVCLALLANGRSRLLIGEALGYFGFPGRRRGGVQDLMNLRSARDVGVRGRSFLGGELRCCLVGGRRYRRFEKHEFGSWEVKIIDTICPSKAIPSLNEGMAFDGHTVSVIFIS